MVETDPFLGAFRFEKCPSVPAPERGCLWKPVMNHYEPTEIEGTDLEPRTERALTEYLTVLDTVGHK